MGICISFMMASESKNKATTPLRAYAVRTFHGGVACIVGVRGIVGDPAGLVVLRAASPKDGRRPADPTKRQHCFATLCKAARGSGHVPCASCRLRVAACKARAGSGRRRYPGATA